MASYIVLTCETGGAFAAEPPPAMNTQHATCPTGKGHWVAMEISPAFDVTSLSKSELSAAFGAGFLIVGTTCLMGVGIRMLIRAVLDFF